MVFPCGHTFHEICINKKRCPVCTKTNKKRQKVRQMFEDDGAIKKMSKRRVQQVMRRMEFTMKRNFQNEEDNKTKIKTIFFDYLALQQMFDADKRMRKKSCGED